MRDIVFSVLFITLEAVDDLHHRLFIFCGVDCVFFVFIFNLKSIMEAAIFIKNFHSEELDFTL